MEPIIHTLSDIFLPIHIVAGFSALATFWLPTLSKKGKRVHRVSGKLYTWFMWIVVISALLLSILNVMKGRYYAAAFLGFLSLITARPLWYGVVILKYKRTVPARLLQIRRLLSGFTFLSSVSLIITALYLRLEGPAILLLIFGSLGLGSIQDVIKSISIQQEAANWLIDHLEGMFITGIAAHTAFFAFGGQRFFAGLFTGPWMAIPWILPTIFGVIAIRVMKRKMQGGKKLQVKEVQI